MENKTIKFSSIEEHADRMFEGSQELTPKQVEWLDSCTEGTWKLNPRTRLVDVDWSFSCSGQDLEDLKGVRFGKVSGDFYCGSNRLTSLEGAPQKVGWAFYLEENPVSYETLTNIFRRMEGGKSYLQAVESLWSKIPPEDQILLYRPEFEWVTPEKKRSIELLIEYNRISEML